jgi:nicotinamide riboside kinase
MKGGIRKMEEIKNRKALRKMKMAELEAIEKKLKYLFENYDENYKEIVDLHERAKKLRNEIFIP